MKLRRGVLAAAAGENVGDLIVDGKKRLQAWFKGGLHAEPG